MLESDFVSSVLKAFDDHSECHSYSKGDFLTKEGELEEHLYFIVKGAVKVYYLTEMEEHIIRLGYDGSILNSLSSFFKEQPSELYIEVLKQSEIKRISKDVIMEVIHKDETSYKQYCKFLESLLMQQLDREIDLLQTSPIDRLNRVLKRSPQLFEHVPLKYIASYLRMKPETLSRIRKY